MAIRYGTSLAAHVDTLYHALARRLVPSAGLLASALLMSGCAASGSMPALGSNGLAATGQGSGSAQTAAAGGQSVAMPSVAEAGRNYAREKKSPTAALIYARTLRAASQPKRALQILAEASELHPDNTEISGEYARAAIEAGETKLALQLLDRAESSAEPDWRLVNARGTVYARTGQLPDAIGQFKKALELAPGEPSVLNNLALAHALDGRLDEAEKLLRQAADREPGSSADKGRVNQNLALVLGLQKRFDEAGQMAADTLPNSEASANLSYLKAMTARKQDT